MVLMECFYGAGTYSVDVDISMSQYRGLAPAIMSLKYLPYYSTIDDACVIDLASQLAKQLNGKDDRTKAAVVLALIQNNIEYVSDEERFGEDVWELPAYTLENRMADCDGMCDLYVSIAYNLGIDVISVILTGHMAPAIHLRRSHGKSYFYDGREYYHVETTDNLPVVGGFMADELQTICAAHPSKPTLEFLQMLERR